MEFSRTVSKIGESDCVKERKRIDSSPLERRRGRRRGA
jgi:hypothetical protein